MLLEDPRPGPSRLVRVSRTVRRQVQPRSLLLGRGGPGGDALLGPPRARASRRYPEPAGLGDARRVLARGQQLRLLARQRGNPVSGVLLVRISGAARLCPGAGPSVAGV